jgi:hypothetical protein
LYNTPINGEEKGNYLTLSFFKIKKWHQKKLKMHLEEMQWEMSSVHFNRRQVQEKENKEGLLLLFLTLYYHGNQALAKHYMERKLWHTLDIMACLWLRSYKPIEGNRFLMLVILEEQHKSFLQIYGQTNFDWTTISTERHVTMCLTMRNRRWRMEIESTAATA